jgi:dihydropyrimidine dehydrogenase (NAD+) subunit PreA
MEKVDDGTEHITWAERTAKGDIPTTFNDQRGGGVGHYIPEPVLALKNGKRRDAQ